MDQLDTGQFYGCNRPGAHLIFLKENAEENPAAMCLVGNKHDLDVLSEREVSTETGETFAKVSFKEWSQGVAFQCSSRNGRSMGLTSLKQVPRQVTMWETPY
jgi:hypothetical protein